MGVGLDEHVASPAPFLTDNVHYMVKGCDEHSRHISFVFF